MEISFHLLLVYFSLSVYQVTHFLYFLRAVSICVALILSMNTLGFPGGAVQRIHLPMQETQETQVRSLGREDPLEKGMVTHSSILAWKIHEQRSLAGDSPWVAKSQT